MERSGVGGGEERGGAGGKEWSGVGRSGVEVRYVARRMATIALSTDHAATDLDGRDERYRRQHEDRDEYEAPDDPVVGLVVRRGIFTHLSIDECSMYVSPNLIRDSQMHCSIIINPKKIISAIKFEM